MRTISPLLLLIAFGCGEEEPRHGFVEGDDAGLGLGFAFYGAIASPDTDVIDIVVELLPDDCPGGEWPTERPRPFMDLHLNLHNHDPIDAALSPPDGREPPYAILAFSDSVFLDENVRFAALSGDYGEVIPLADEGQLERPLVENPGTIGGEFEADFTGWGAVALRFDAVHCHVLDQHSPVE